MAAECVFCNISKLKEDTIFENEHCFVKLDKFPNEVGHMLVISKKHTADMLTADNHIISEMFLVAKKMANLSKAKLGASGVNIQTNIGKDAGQFVFHFHIHVIPRYPFKHKNPHKELDEATKKELIAKLR
jgi:histidine triad (HIT) family protein